MTQDEFDRLPPGEGDIYRRAGILPGEVMMHPEMGALLNETAVRKLAARAPDQDLAEQFIDWFDIAARR